MCYFFEWVLGGVALAMLLIIIGHIVVVKVV